MAHHTDFLYTKPHDIRTKYLHALMGGCYDTNVAPAIQPEKTET